MAAMKYGREKSFAPATVVHVDGQQFTVTNYVTGETQQGRAWFNMSKEPLETCPDKSPVMGILYPFQRTEENHR
jgi:hypothetical protein